MKLYVLLSYFLFKATETETLFSTFNRNFISIFEMLVLISLFSNILNFLYKEYLKFSEVDVISLRQWEKIHDGKNKTPGYIFTLMSYNVLAQDLADMHPYLYCDHNQSAMKWSRSRFPNLFKEIKRINPDVSWIIIYFVEFPSLIAGTMFARSPRRSFRELLFPITYFGWAYSSFFIKLMLIGISTIYFQWLTLLRTTILKQFMIHYFCIGSRVPQNLFLFYSIFKHFHRIQILFWKCSEKKICLYSIIENPYNIFKAFKEYLKSELEIKLMVVPYITKKRFSIW